MHYRLKKDLPFAKAGAEITPPNDEGFPYDVKNIHEDLWNICYEEELVGLIESGWIEEVKPRVWELGIDKDGCVVATSKECCIPISVVNECKEIIKVREVIE